MSDLMRPTLAEFAPGPDSNQRPTGRLLESIVLWEEICKRRLTAPTFPNQCQLNHRQETKALDQHG